MKATPRLRAAQLLGTSLASCVLGAVFVAYLDPHRALELINRAWGCF